MNLNEALKNRRSIRKWKSKKIPKKLVEELVNAALLAPSSCNRQAVKFLAVESPENVKFLGSITNGGAGFAHKAPLMLLAMADTRVYSLPIERHTSYLDCAAAIQNLLLKAHELGLGACWLNWCLNQKNEDETCRRFKIPRHFLPCSLIAVGFPDIKAKPVPRKPLEEGLVWEKF